MALSGLKTFLQNECPGLFAILADCRDRVAPRYAEPELALVPTLAEPGEAAFDVGANTGMYSYWLLRCAAGVTAFEPNPKLAALLRRRFKARIAEGRMAVQAAAVSNAAGETQLYIQEGYEALASVAAEGHGGGTAVTVPLVRLDDFQDRTVGFIKIDVEGHEVAAVEGGLGLIARDRPTLLIEAEERHHAGSIAALRGHLEPLDYRGFYLQGGALRPLDGFDMALLQNRAALNEAGTHRLPGQTYINNFIFVARQPVLDRLGRQVPLT
ncbi:FkbM family methyltransferase [Oceanibaculum pacificum]|uniref:Methyltransferase FkbM domain-containing protein n=1 Tax=Oceanibaculum pacificum TaxID=580166 RepID=A0A154W3H2_9PROT|nr:FkbM family methyltransferase [Oceanibaculum pacificum]KZD07961.1 hypothetical protein AUP43_09215 [Oceanibaculum pacificum]